MIHVYKCPICQKEIPMRATEFPLRCLCGHKSEDGSDSLPCDHTVAPLPRQPRKTRPKQSGDYLKDIIAAVGGSMHAGCGCEDMANKMNLWGPDGCREHRAEIVAKLQENAKKLGWWETVAMGAKLMQEPWFNPLDPAGSMVDEAIRRAEATPVSSGQ